MSGDIQPEIVDGIPLCSERCPSYDGKRCELMGHRPDRICEPEVSVMAMELKRLRKIAGSMGRTKT